MPRWRLQEDSDRYKGLKVMRSRETKVSAVLPMGDRMPNARIQTCGFIADIVISKNESGQIYHYVIQREGSPQVEHWGQELSFKRALDCIDDFLEPFRNKMRFA